MIKEIEYTGYEAATPDNLASDGSLSAAIGLVKQDGGMRAATSPNEVMNVPAGYTLVFKHRVSSGETNYILLNTYGEMYWLQEGGEISKDNALQSIQFHNFTDIDCVGNTLVILSGTPHYILWKNNTYNYLGTKVPNIDISFGIRGWHRHIENFEGITLDGDDKINWDLSSGEILLTESQGRTISNSVYAILNKYTAEWGENTGCFTNPFFVRMALTLYDGTVINRSSPVFMMPCRVPHIEIYETKFEVSSMRATKISYSVHMIAAMLDYQIMSSSKEELEKWKDIIQSVDFYVSKPIYFYNPNQNIDRIKSGHQDRTFFHGRLCIDNLNPVFYYYNDVYSGNMKAFNSRNFTADPGRIVYGRFNHAAINTLSGYNMSGDYFPLQEYSDKRVKEIMEGEHPCYKFYSIPIDDLLKDDYDFDFSTDDWMTGKTYSDISWIAADPCGAFTRRVLVPQRAEQLKTIETQPAIETDTESDYYDRDQLFAEQINAYNNSVSLYKIQRQYNNPVAPTCMFQFKNSQKVIYSTEYGAGMRIYNFGTESQEVDILIEEDDGNFMLVSYDDASCLHIDQSEDDIADSFIFCPYPKAKKIFLFNGDNISKGCFCVELSTHKFLNGAFAWIGKSKLETNMTYEEWESIKSSCSPSNRVSLFGKIYTSKLNNPFVFSPTNVYSFSGAEVIGMASVTKALSQGQFGQFPMYAFTSDGIWALEVNASTGGYSAKQPVTRDVCINPLSITQGDNCIYFVSDRGLMLLAGADTACISDVLDDHFAQSLKDTLPGYNKFISIAGISEKQAIAQSFNEFIKDAQIVYDYINQRLIVFNPTEKAGETNTAYAYSLASRSWSFVENSIYKKLNSYPEALGVTRGGGIVNLSTITDGTEGTGMLVTRPLSLDAPEVHKTVDTIIQRGKFRKGCIKQALWGSRDLIHWHLVASSNSHILRHVHGTPFKWFRVGVIATLKDDETLTGCSISYTPKLMNKLR